jgi:hypothetical protein
MRKRWADAELLDLVLDEKLCRLGECLLDFTDADDARVWLQQAVLDYGSSHEVGFA